MSSAVAPDEQLEWEARAGRPAAYLAFATAALLLVGALIYPIAFVGSQPNTLALTLLKLDKSPADLLVPGTFQAIGYLMLPVPLAFLFKAVRARREEMLQAGYYLAIFGPIATAIAFVVHQFALIGAAHDFADKHLNANLQLGVPGGLAQAIEPVLRAESGAYHVYQDAVGSPVVVALQYVGALATAFALVLISLNAMRAGLLSRFVGTIGIIIGVLTIIPLLGQFSIVLTVFWLGSLGMLFLNRTPNGRGPAWSVVEQVPWPTAAEQRAAALEAREGASGNGHVDEPEEDQDDRVDYEDEVDDDGPGASSEHPRSQKRKRKRRR
jgi:hypothetical protein